MNNKEDPKKPDSKIRLLFKRLDPGKYGIKNKLQLLIFAVVFGAILLVSIFGLIYHKSVIYRNSIDKLSSVQEYSKELIELYFSQANNHIKLLSDNEVVINAIREFKNAYMAVEDDNYYTSSASGIEDVSALLESYYETEYIEDINGKLDIDLDAKNFIPDNNNAKILQFLYITNNDKPTGLKYRLNRAEDGTVYSDVHNKYHPYFRDWLTKFNYADIYLVDDETGNIIYSVSKKLDFATNLVSGPYNRSNLSEAYKSAAGAINSGYTVTVDFENYYPSHLAPSLFIASPVYDNLEKIGVLVFQVSVKTIDNLMHIKKSEDDDERICGLQSLVIGNDRYLRNNDLRLVTDKEEYLRTLKKARANIDVVHKIEKLSTTALIQSVSKELFSDNNNGYAGQGKYKDISKTGLLCTYTPLDIKDLNWILITQANTRDLFKSVRTIIYLLIIISIFIIILSLMAGGSFSKRLSGRINDINKLLITLSKGESFSVLKNSQHDELGSTVESLNTLMRRIHEASDFATNLGEGKFDYEFSACSENDKLGVSLEKMKNSLLNAREEEEKRKKEDEIRNWTTNGIARFNDILRTDNDNIEKLSYNLIKNLIDYLSANQGGLFLLEGEENQEKQLNLIASYAYDRRKYLKKQVKIGEGLAGTCVLEKKTIFLKDIPEDYAEITSGLGGSHPRSVMIIPMNLDDEVLGVIELASFNIFKQYEIDFVEQVALSIASTMVAVKLNMQTARLLKESNKRAEELAQQEEEMRQNLEEMQATQDELKRLKEDEKKVTEQHRKEQEELMKKLKEQNEELNNVQVEMLKETALLNNLMNFSPDYIYFKDKQSKFIRISKTMARSFGFKKPEDAAGMSDFDLFTDEHARPAFNDEMKIIKTGKPIVDKIEKETRSDGRITWVTTTKMPLKDEKGKTIGTFGVSSDITKIKKLEIKAHEIEVKSKKLQEELKKANAMMSKLKKGKK